MLKNICRNKIAILLTATTFNNMPGDILSIYEQYGYPLLDGASAKVKELESEIDQLVYKLYSLVDEEIRIVISGYKMRNL